MRRRCPIVLSALWLAAALPVAAQSPPPADAPAAIAAPASPALDPAAATDPGAVPTDPASMPADPGFEAYVDGLAAALLAREDLAGLVVSVVRDDRVLLAKGYGMARFEPARAADGDRTMFRIGSISKTFTYTAAMQLVAEGRLSLDDAVNDHLPPALALPDDGFAEPIRIRHLMTHTAGYEDSALGHLFVRDAAAVLAPEEYLVRHRPRRVRPPGVAAAYSNYSLAVLGAVIAHVSGLPFVDYVEQRLTGPLGMQRTTFREPMPAGDPRGLEAALAGDIAIGYQRSGGAFVPGPFEYIGQIAAAGGASATAADMARWMRMHLAYGALDGVRVLPEATSRAMREVLFRNGDRTPGIAHGFLTGPLGPYESWGHGGATLFFHSGMVMVPERNLGVFASSNTDLARGPVAEFARLVLERLLPEAAAPAQALATDAATLARYEGSWRSIRRNYSTLEKLVLALGGDATVAAASDGSLRLTNGGDTTRYVPIGPDLFQEAEGPGRLQFLAGADGVPDRFVAGTGTAVSERIGVLDSIALLGGLLLLALWIAVVRVVRSFKREKRGHESRPGLFGVRALAVGAALGWIVFLVVLAFAASDMLGARSEVMFTFPTATLRIALWLALLAALLTVLELLALPAVWRSAWRGWPKLRYTAGVLVLAAGVALMWRWHLVDWPA
jgi:CubicO group peptidase (beta-lactamase class C family)